jgi:hypothetical protein
MTGSRDETPLVRMKPAYDGVVPGGNSAASMALLRLGALTGRQKFTQTARRVLESFSMRLQAYGAALADMLCAADFLLGPASEIVIHGHLHDASMQEMLAEIRRRFLPRTVLLAAEPGRIKRELETISEFVKYQKTGETLPLARSRLQLLMI